MEYLRIDEIAKRWGIGARRVQLLCSEGKIRGAVAVEDGYRFEEVRVRVEQALAAFFNGRLLGKGVRVAELNSLIFQLEGVQNVKLSAPAADIAARQGVLPKAGSVSITEMEA